MESKAGFVYRWAAYVIDQLVAIPFIIIASLVFKNQDWLGAVTGLMYLVYLWLATGMYGTTLGKKLFYLKVVKTDGTKLSMGGAFVREVVGKILSSVFFSLGFLWALWDKNNQTWHDKLAKTYVVQYQEVSSGRKLLAYLVALILPILAILGIVAAIVLVAINPAAKIREAREMQSQNDLRQQQFQQQMEY